MAEERIGGVFIEAYVKGVEEAERRLRDLEARASSIGAGGGGGYPVGGPTGGGAPAGGGGYPVGGGSARMGGRSAPMDAIKELGRQTMTPEEFTAAFGDPGGTGGRSRTTVGPGGGGGRSAPGFIRPDTQGPRPTPGFLNVEGFGETGRSAPNVGLMAQATAGAVRMQKELDKAAEGAGEKLGLRAAWILRSATGGGMLGAVGGGLGALAGLAMGNPAFGALIGNMAGRQVGDAGDWAAGNMDKVGRSWPGLGFQRQRAEADAEAAESRAYVETYKRRTNLEKQWADFYASGGRGLGGAISEGIERESQSWSRVWLTLMERLQGPGTPGSGTGLSRGPFTGRMFSGGDDLYKTAMTFALQNQTTASGGVVGPSMFSAPIFGGVGGVSLPEAITGSFAAYDAQSPQKHSSDLTAIMLGGPMGWLVNQVVH